MITNSCVNFLFEAATLKRLQRTGWQILGGNKESVAEHSFMVAVIAFLLAQDQKVDMEKVLVMSIFHDFSETRTGDLYKLADLYVEADEKKAENDSFNSFGESGRELFGMMDEYRKKESAESIIVHDADTLSLCIELKQLIENGNLHATEWFEANAKRLILQKSILLFSEIKKTDSQNWWKKQRDILHKMMV